MSNLTQKPLQTIGVLWLLAALLAWPFGDFPLDDDWAYAEAVKYWVDTGHYRVSDWPAMTLFTQVVWGGIFAKVFGFSFYTLRLSTLVLSLLGLLAFQRTMIRLKLPGYWQLFAMLTLVFNPIFFELSFTFMTDVPFLSLTAMSLYAYLRAFEKDQGKWWAAATLLSSLAILLRQPALLIPLAMGTAGFLAKPSWRRFGLAVASTGLVYFCLQGYILWQEHTPTGLPGAFTKPGSIRRLLTFDNLAFNIKTLGGLYLMYIGFMLLPVLLLCRFTPRTRVGWWLTGLIAAVSLGLIGLAWGEEPLGNTVHPGGLGTISLPGERWAEHWPRLPQSFGVVAKMLGTIGWLLLIGFSTPVVSAFLQLYLKRLKEKQRPLLNPAQTLRLGLTGLLVSYALFLLVNTYHFDRYLLPVLLGGLLLIKPGPKPSKWAISASAFLLLLMATFSVAGTHDYFAWNRARWAALDAVMDQGVPPTQIDGGFEFNGWYRTGPRGPHEPYTKSWWFVAEDVYAVSFGPFDNYSVKDEVHFQRYLPPGLDTIFLLRRPDWVKADTLFYPMESGQWPDYAPYARLRPSEKLRVQPESYNGTQAYEMPADQEYGFSHHLFPVRPFDELQFSVWVNDGPGRPGIVVSALDPEDFHHLKHLFPTQEKTRSGWQKYRATMRLPDSFPSDTLACYFWKTSQRRILMDDFQIIWKQANN